MSDEHSEAFRIIDKLDRFCGQYTEEFSRKLALGESAFENDAESRELIISKNLCFSSCVAPRETESTLECLRLNNGEITPCKKELASMWDKYKKFWQYYMNSETADTVFNSIPEECVQINKNIDKVLAQDPKNEKEIERLQHELFVCEAKTRFPKQWQAFQKCEEESSPMKLGRCKEEYQTLLDSLEKTSLDLLDVFEFNKQDRQTVKEMGTQQYMIKLARIIETGTRAIPKT